MSLVQLADVVVPEVFDPYVSLRTTEKSALYQTGVIAPDAGMGSKLTMGGRTFTTPHWNDLGNDEATPASDDPDDEITPKKITTGSSKFIRQFRAQAWSTANLTGELAGSDPAAEIGNKVGDYWGRQLDRMAIATIKGVIADNVANDSSDMVYNMTGLSGTVTVGGASVAAYKLHANGILEAKQTMGDNAEGLRMIVMHSRLYTNLQQQDLIAFIPNSQGVRNIPTYCGYQVLASDMCPADVDGSDILYTTYLCGPGVLRYVEKAPIKPVETKSEPLKGGGAGVEYLVHRKQFALHPPGFSWLDASVADEFPTNAELAAAANWDRKYPERKMIPLVVIKSKNG